MITLEKWLAVNDYEFAVPVVQKILAVCPAKWNAVPCTEDSKLVLVYHESEDRTHYMDFEIDSDGTFFWFYRNRLTDEIGGSESPEVELSAPLKEKMRCLISA